VSGARRLPGQPLTERQVQVLGAAARGLNVRQTARELHLAENTVRGHRAIVLRALQARSTAHAVAIAFRRGILS
jgi:two-component system, NarL family, response regulator DesR